MVVDGMRSEAVVEVPEVEEAAADVEEAAADVEEEGADVEGADAGARRGATLTPRLCNA